MKLEASVLTLFFAVSLLSAQTVGMDAAGRFVEPRIDGDNADWIGSPAVVEDGVGDVGVLDEGQPPFAPLSSDDIRRYACVIGRDWVYCYFEPDGLPTDNYYRYRIQFLTRVDNAWRALFMVLWSSNGDGLEIRTPAGEWIFAQGIGMQFARGSCFEARVPRILFTDLPMDIYAEATIWHGRRNTVDACFARPRTAGSVLYDLELDAANARARVTARFQNYPPDSFRLAPHSGAEDSFPSALAPQYVSEGRITALTVRGATVDVERRGDVAAAFSVQYTVPLNVLLEEGSGGYLGYITPTYFLSGTGWTFLEPQAALPLSFGFRFTSLPSDWTPLAVWDEREGVYRDDDPELFYDQTIAAGRFEVRERTIAGTRFIVAVDATVNQPERSAVFDGCFAVSARIKALFTDDAIPERFLAVFGWNPSDGMWQHGNESGLSHGELLRSAERACRVQEHRLFHAYNCFPPNGMNVESGWFLEGPNMFFESVAIAELGMETPFDSIREWYRDEYLSGRAEFDAPLAGITHSSGDWDQVEYLLYWKGIMVSFLLDAEIRRGSGGAYDLGDLQRVLYDACGASGLLVTDAMICERASALAGRDLTAFFEDYVHGTRFIDLEPYFRDDDRDGVLNAAEEVLRIAFRRPQSPAGQHRPSGESETKKPR